MIHYHSRGFFSVFPLKISSCNRMQRQLGDRSPMGRTYLTHSAWLSTAALLPLLLCVFSLSSLSSRLRLPHAHSDASFWLQIASRRRSSAASDALFTDDAKRRSPPAFWHIGGCDAQGIPTPKTVYFASFLSAPASQTSPTAFAVPGFDDVRQITGERRAASTESFWWLRGDVGSDAAQRRGPAWGYAPAFVDHIDAIIVKMSIPPYEFVTNFYSSNPDLYLDVEAVGLGVAGSTNCLFTGPGLQPHFERTLPRPIACILRAQQLSDATQEALNAGAKAIPFGNASNFTVHEAMSRIASNLRFTMSSILTASVIESTINATLSVSLNVTMMSYTLTASRTTLSGLSSNVCQQQIFTTYTSQWGPFRRVVEDVRQFVKQNATSWLNLVTPVGMFGPLTARLAVFFSVRHWARAAAFMQTAGAVNWTQFGLSSPLQVGPKRCAAWLGVTYQYTPYQSEFCDEGGCCCGVDEAMQYYWQPSPAIGVSGYWATTITRQPVTDTPISNTTCAAAAVGCSASAAWPADIRLRLDLVSALQGLAVSDDSAVVDVQFTQDGSTLQQLPALCSVMAKVSVPIRRRILSRVGTASRSFSVSRSSIPTSSPVMTLSRNSISSSATLTMGSHSPFPSATRQRDSGSPSATIGSLTVSFSLPDTGTISKSGTVSRPSSSLSITRNTISRSVPSLSGSRPSASLSSTRNTFSRSGPSLSSSATASRATATETGTWTPSFSSSKSRPSVSASRLTLSASDSFYFVCNVPTLMASPDSIVLEDVKQLPVLRAADGTLLYRGLDGSGGIVPREGRNVTLTVVNGAMEALLSQEAIAGTLNVSLSDLRRGNVNLTAVFQERFSDGFMRYRDLNGTLLHFDRLSTPGLHSAALVTLTGNYTPVWTELDATLIAYTGHNGEHVALGHVSPFDGSAKRVTGYVIQLSRRLMDTGAVVDIVANASASSPNASMANGGGAAVTEDERRERSRTGGIQLAFSIRVDGCVGYEGSHSTQVTAFLPAVPLPPIVPDAVMVALQFFVSVSSSGAAQQATRALAVAQMSARCRPDAGLDANPDLADQPLGFPDTVAVGFGLGPSRGRFHRGAVVANVAVFLALAALGFALAAVVRTCASSMRSDTDDAGRPRRRRRCKAAASSNRDEHLDEAPVTTSWRSACSFVRMPAVLLVPFSVLLDGTMASAVANAHRGRNWFDFLLLATTVGCVAAGVVFLFRAAMHVPLRFVAAPEGVPKVVVVAAGGTGGSPSTDVTPPPSATGTTLSRFQRWVHGNGTWEPAAAASTTPTSLSGYSAALADRAKLPPSALPATHAAASLVDVLLTMDPNDGADKGAADDGLPLLTKRSREDATTATDYRRMYGPVFEKFHRPGTRVAGNPVSDAASNIVRDRVAQHFLVIDFSFTLVLAVFRGVDAHPYPTLCRGLTIATMILLAGFFIVALWLRPYLGPLRNGLLLAGTGLTACASVLILAADATDSVIVRASAAWLAVTATFVSTVAAVVLGIRNVVEKSIMVGGGVRKHGPKLARSASRRLSRIFRPSSPSSGGARGDSSLTMQVDDELAEELEAVDAAAEETETALDERAAEGILDGILNADEEETAAAVVPAAATDSAAAVSGADGNAAPPQCLPVTNRSQDSPTAAPAESRHEWRRQHLEHFLLGADLLDAVGGEGLDIPPAAHVGGAFALSQSSPAFAAAASPSVLVLPRSEDQRPRRRISI